MSLDELILGAETWSEHEVLGIYSKLQQCDGVLAALQPPNTWGS